MKLKQSGSELQMTLVKAADNDFYFLRLASDGTTVLFDIGDMEDLVGLNDVFYNLYQGISKLVTEESEDKTKH